MSNGSSGSTVTFPNAIITFETGSVSVSFVFPDSVTTMLTDLEAKVDSLISKGDQIVSNQSSNQRTIMAQLDDLETVGKESVALLKVLHDELVASLGDPARVQAVIDKLKAAIAANPDPGVAPPPAPPAGP